ncbi:MAG: SRPBCC family protein [Chloroflexi bacterium]|nr:SRPBCC family protein [Chloroflexota bacterium]
MRQFHFSAERLIQAPVEVVYHCLADYREHHRVDGGFLPPAFTRLDVLEGGVGAGTVIRFTAQVGGRSVTRTQQVSEPEPGRVLKESGGGEGSTFTLDRVGDATRLRIDTTLNAPGVEGLLMRWFGARLMQPLYADEMSRLEKYAQAHAAVSVA